MLIASKENPLLKHAASLLKRKARDEKGRFLLEGKKFVKEALEKTDLVEVLLVSEHIEIDEIIPPDFTGQLVRIKDNLGRLLTDTKTPQGVWAVCRKPVWDYTSNLNEWSLLLILAGVQDPGNLGTMLRTAKAFGVDAVVLLEKTVDVFNPKVLRASAGTVLTLPVLPESDEEKLWGFKRSGFVFVLCEPQGVNDIKDLPSLSKVALVIGGEGQGIPQEVKNFGDISARIPMSSEVDSLNVAVACGIVLYECSKKLKKIILPNGRS